MPDVNLNAVFLDANHQARAIKALKDREEPPTGKWDVSMMTDKSSLERETAPVAEGRIITFGAVGTFCKRCACFMFSSDVVPYCREKSSSEG